jgi:hypothetical protein
VAAPVAAQPATAVPPVEPPKPPAVAPEPSTPVVAAPVAAPPVAATPISPPPKPVEPPPVVAAAPKPVEPPAPPAAVPPVAAPPVAAPVAVAPAPPVAAPAPPPPAYVIARVPPPTLAKPAEPAHAGPAANPDQAVADFRAAVRRNEVARATSLLGSVSGDTGGYKDMVKSLTALRARQDAVAALLTLSVAAEQPGRALGALTEVAAWPDLQKPATQARAWIAEVERGWDQGLAATLDAARRGDKAAAAAILAQIPSGDALTPAYQTRRAQVAAQVAALP